MPRLVQESPTIHLHFSTLLHRIDIKMSTNKTLDSGEDLQSVEERKTQIDKQNIEIRDQPSLKQECLDVQSWRLTVPPCPSSMSTLTGLTALSIGSRVPRPCQVLRSSRIGLSSHRVSPSILLQHGHDWMTEEDQRILNIMVMRREAQMEAEDISLSARNLWEKDRIAYNQFMNEKQKQWHEFVQEKRRIEKVELERRKEDAELSMKCHRVELEERINQRHARCEKRHDDIINKKRLNKGEVDTDEFYHRLRKEQILQDDRLRSNLHLDVITAKERQVEENLKAIACYRDRRIRERCYRRQRKMEAAQQLRDSLNQRYEEWCEDNIRLLNNKLRLSEYRAAKVVDWRRRMLQEKNQMKILHHAHIMAELEEEDRARELRAKQELLTKDSKVKHHLDKKEQAKARSRMNALTTANLRQKIKASYHLTG